VPRDIGYIFVNCQMLELFDQLPLLAVLFVVVFVLNVIPAFAPPTWMTLSYIGLTAPDMSPLLLALTGAVAATLGRLSLAKLSRVIVRGKALGEQTRKNVDRVKIELEKHRAFTFGAFLVYAFSPLPSNYLFIAYGLTTLRLPLVAAPFFIGRFVSYSFWVTSASLIGNRLDVDSIESGWHRVIYFVMSQLLLVPALYAFARIDWHSLFEKRRLKWL
jgi:hypothetical protein